MKRSVFKCLSLGKLLILMLVIACAICAYKVTVKRTVIPLTFEASQFCTNHVVSCLVDNAHPGFVVLGYNKKVYITALDLEKTGFLTVHIANCLSNDVAVKCVSKEIWDVDFSGYVYTEGLSVMSIWEKESGGGFQSSEDNPDIELYDEKSGSLLCALYVRRTEPAVRQGQQL